MSLGTKITTVGVEKNLQNLFSSLAVCAVCVLCRQFFCTSASPQQRTTGAEPGSIYAQWGRARATNLQVTPIRNRRCPTDRVAYGDRHLQSHLLSRSEAGSLGKGSGRVHEHPLMLSRAHHGPSLTTIHKRQIWRRTCLTRAENSLPAAKYVLIFIATCSHAALIVQSTSSRVLSREKLIGTDGYTWFTGTASAMHVRFPIALSCRGIAASCHMPSKMLCGMHSAIKVSKVDALHNCDAAYADTFRCANRHHSNRVAVGCIIISQSVHQPSSITRGGTLPFNKFFSTDTSLESGVSSDCSKIAGAISEDDCGVCANSNENGHRGETKKERRLRKQCWYTRTASMMTKHSDKSGHDEIYQQIKDKGETPSRIFFDQRMYLQATEEAVEQYDGNESALVEKFESIRTDMEASGYECKLIR